MEIKALRMAVDEQLDVQKYRKIIEWLELPVRLLPLLAHTTLSY